VGEPPLLAGLGGGPPGLHVWCARALVARWRGVSDFGFEIGGSL
jgi:hypothetical protein